MTTLIIVDYKSMEKTIQYMQYCMEYIEDVEEIHFVIVDNSDVSRQGIELMSSELEGINLSPVNILGVDRKALYGEYHSRKILYLCAEENLGYAKGNNLGAKVAQIYFGDRYYLFSNNDLRFMRKISLANLQEPMKKEEAVAVVGPRIFGVDQRDQSPRRFSTAGNKLFLYYLNLLLPKNKKIKRLLDVDQPRKSGKCDWVTGSFLYVDAVKFHEVGGFDEHTFLYYEEVILAERLRKKGYGMYYEDSIQIIHDHGQTVKNVFSVLKGIRISFESSLYYYRTYKNLPDWIAIIAKIHYKIFEILFSVKMKLKPDKKRKM